MLEEEKSRLVGHVFSSVASSYDLMSVGLHRLRKDRMLLLLPVFSNESTPFPRKSFVSSRPISKFNPFPGMKQIDVAGGRGSNISM